MTVAVGRTACLTDPGRRRRHNEDSYFCDPPLFAVADGMGGAQAGELASGLAAAALRDDQAERAGGEERVDELIQEANRRVYERQTQDASASGMGTTMTVALVEDGIVAFGHVGDSRAYLVRDGGIEQLTEDHSLVAELVRSGKLSPEEAEDHPQRSVITRALGTDPDVDVDTFSIEAKPGDLFLICSDGLSSMVDDDDILQEIERSRGNLDGAAQALIRAANRGGGEDNITVVFFEIADSDQPGETVTLPPPEDTAESIDIGDDDTLDELDRVPAVETRVIPASELGIPPREPEHEPQREPEQRRSRRGVLVAVIALVLLAGASGFVVWGLWRSHFVGADSNGHVAVYQGVPWDIVGNVRLYRTVYVSPVLAAQLSRVERQELFDHSLQSENAALADVRRYEEQTGTR